MKSLLALSFLLLLLSSCSTRDEIVYFQNAENLEGMENLLEYEPIIQPNDVLRINVSSQIEEIAAPFQNQASRGAGGAGGGQNLSLTGYLTNPDGFIQFPVLGAVKVGGKTRSEVQKLLQEQIREYVTDAVVDVRIVNFNVTVIGEVNARVPVNDGRISMPELLATAGGIPYTGKRENILIIREVNGIKSIGRIDMTETDLFSSPYYYLRQNDIVYVEPTYRRVKSAGFFTSYQGIISIGTTIISLYLLINNL